MTIISSWLCSIKFTILQYIEYVGSNMGIDINSIFYIVTGLHGIHMLIGEILLMVIIIREYIEISREEKILKRIGMINLNFLDICFIIILILAYD